MIEGDKMFWADEQKVSPLSEADYNLRVRFVEQYVLDHSPYKACLRLGFHARAAESYGHQFLAEPVVQNLIKEYEENFYKRLKNRDETLMSVIASRLYGEAMTAQNDSTRVNALSKLINMMDMDKSVKQAPPRIYIGVKDNEEEITEPDTDDDTI